MNIAYIIPGSGGSFYCGNCLRDNAYFHAIRAQGHNALKIPLYLPLFSHEQNEFEAPVFYGAVNLYLKQQFSLFRRMPSWVDAWLNSPAVLRFAAKKAHSTRASGLEDMTISMLMGEHGQQKEELEKLVHWMETHFKADVIHISNALLLGLAHKLRERLKVPVVCSLQDEDVWVEPMHPEFGQKVWDLMAEKAADVDMFIPVSHYFSAYMQEKLSLSEDRMRPLYLGIDPANYTCVPALEKPRTIGYLSRMCYSNGLDILVDAFILLKKDTRNNDVRLALTGGYTSDDVSFLKKQKRKLADAGLIRDVDFIEDFDGEHRHSFLGSIRMLSVPVRRGEAFGIYLTESMASGVPIVQPRLGAFAEIVEQSGGGLVYPENTPESLCEALDSMLNNNEGVARMSQNARKSAESLFNINLLAAKLTDIYGQAINKYKENVD